MPRTIIIGAGIIGASTAYFLSHSTSRSQDDTITVVDPNPPASGASGKAAGVISRNWTGIATASLEALSFRLHKELAQQYGGTEKWGYRPCEVLAVEAGNKRADSSEVVWGERHKNASKTEYTEVLKWIKPEVIMTQALLGEPGSFAQIDPHQFTMFLLEAAISKGVKMVQGKASSMSTENDRVIQIDVACTEGSILTLPCDRLLIAAGPWTGPLSDTLLPTRIPIEPYAGHSVLLRPSTATSPHTLFVTLYGQKSYRAELVPRSSGDIYISGVNDTLPLPPTPDLAIPQKTEIDKLKEIADALLPSYTVLKEQLAFRPMTENGKPYICPYPKVDGVFIGAGHGHFGIILGTGTGKVLSEMILGNELSVDVSQFSL